MARHFRRALSSTHRGRIAVPTSNLSPRAAVAVTQQCPPPTHPTCSCDPADLDIDRDTALRGTMPRYASHVVIGTGATDWPSRIEFAPDGVASRLKRSLKKHGDPFSPVLVTNSSLPAALAAGQTSVYVFPQGWWLPHLSDRQLDGFAASLSPPTTATPTPAAPATVAPPAATTPTAPATRAQVDSPTVLICSHLSRDSRCGAYYASLRAEFEAVLRRLQLHERVTVAATSHLGGHKWAGNVIVYMPGGGPEGAAGWGVWYGRVGVRDVCGIVSETIVHGRVVGELVRGVVGRELEDEGLGG